MARFIGIKKNNTPWGSNSNCFSPPHDPCLILCFLGFAHKQVTFEAIQPGSYSSWACAAPHNLFSGAWHHYPIQFFFLGWTPPFMIDIMAPTAHVPKFPPAISLLCIAHASAKEFFPQVAQQKGLSWEVWTSILPTCQNIKFLWADDVAVYPLVSEKL